MTTTATEWKELRDIAWEDLQRLTLVQKGPYFNREEGERHVLIAQQFARERLDAIGSLASRIRTIAKTCEGERFLKSQLDTFRAMLYFTQPSSRTFLSFTAACQTLGMACCEVRDAATSSEVKGETQEDSVRTFSSYCDIIIMRCPDQGLAERMAWLLSHSERPLPIVNAGSGKDQHPTQAVLDIYTLQRSFERSGGIDGKCVAFVGDLLRGRTVRSLSYLLTLYSDVRMLFIAPDELQISDDIRAMLDERGVTYEVGNDFESAVAEADALYMTRIQDEWDSETGDSSRIDTSRYCFTPRHLEVLKPTAVIMHPFPRRDEIAVEVDRDPRAVYWRQMRNGMWVRTALIAGLFDREAEILSYDE